MNKSIIFLSIACLATSIYAIDSYRTNSDCYEIIPFKQPIQQQVLLNKCLGTTWTLVRSDLPEEGEKKQKRFTYNWVKIIRDDYAQVAIEK